MTKTIVPQDPRGSLPQIIVNHEGLYEGTLVEYFQALFHLGKNLNAPYHNFRHCTHVLYLCHEAARFYSATGELSKREVRNMLVAALFHDFNHSGSAGDDANNIEQAISALKEFLLPEDKPFFNEIALLITGTQYPYALSEEDLPFAGWILRDADLMQAFSMAWIQQVIFGLAAEWGKSPQEVLAMQPGFLGNIKFLTDWGRGEVPEEAVALKINEAIALLDIVSIPARSEEIRKMQQEAA